MTGGYVVPLTRAMSAALDRVADRDPGARVVGHQDGLPVVWLPSIAAADRRCMVLTTTGRLERARHVTNRKEAA